MKKLYFVVGPMGCGKNYVGKRLADELGYPFIDGDAFVPTSMAKKVADFKFLNQQDIDNFVTEHLIPGVETAYDETLGLVVAQALYRAEHRQQIREHFGNACQIVFVKTNLFTNLKRLLKRDQGFRWMLYGLCNRVFFQSKDFDQVIYN